MTSTTFSKPIQWAIGSWSFFILENVVLSENRTYIISQIFHNNDDYYHYLYGLCSTTAVTSIGYAYYKHIKPFSCDKMNEKLLLWNAKQLVRDNAVKMLVPLQNRILSFGVLSLGLGLISQTFPKLQIPLEYIGSGIGGNIDDNQQNVSRNNQDGELPSSSTSSTTLENKKWKVRCPFDFSDSKSRNQQYQLSSSSSSSSSTNNNTMIHQKLTIHDIHGIDRITRHPSLWSFGLSSLSLSFLSPCIPTRIYFAMPLLMSLIGGYHNDSRFRRNIGGSINKDYDSLTSNVPFYAWIVGRQGDDRIRLIRDFYDHEVKGLNLVLGIGVAALFVVRKGRVGGIGGQLVSNHR